MGNGHILVYDHIISYQRIKVYRVETMDMGIFRWKNGVGGKFNPSKDCGIYFTGYDTLVGVIWCRTMTHC